jgi:hypothetical protein
MPLFVTSLAIASITGSVCGCSTIMCLASRVEHHTVRRHRRRLQRRKLIDEARRLKQEDIEQKRKALRDINLQEKSLLVQIGNQLISHRLLRRAFRELHAQCRRRKTFRSVMKHLLLHTESLPSKETEGFSFPTSNEEEGGGNTYHQTEAPSSFLSSILWGAATTLHEGFLSIPRVQNCRAILAHQVERISHPTEGGIISAAGWLVSQHRDGDGNVDPAALENRWEQTVVRSAGRVIDAAASIGGYLERCTRDLELPTTMVSPRAEEPVEISLLVWRDICEVADPQTIESKEMQVIEDNQVEGTPSHYLIAC